MLPELGQLVATQQQIVGLLQEIDGGLTAIYIALVALLVVETLKWPRT